MKLLRRMRNIVNSNLNAMVACAEDPEKLLQQCISDMQDQSAKARTQVAQAIAAEKKLGRLVSVAEAEAERLEAAAAAAAKETGGRSGAARSQDVGLGDYNDAVRDAVRRHIAGQHRAQELHGQWNQQLESVGLLKTALGELQAKIDEARRRKDVLIARKRVAVAKRDVHASLAGIAEANCFLDAQAFEAFDRVAEQVENTEAQAEAAAEVCAATLGPAAGSWSSAGISDAEVDAALVELQGDSTTAPRD